MKVKIKNLSKESRIQTLDALYTAAGTVKGRNAMKLFLRDLLTESERIMLGRRILIARYLIANKTYDSIAEELHVGYDTVRRVDKWLNDQMPGYENAIKDMETEFSKRGPKKDSRAADGGIDKYLYATSAIYRLKKKYPIHFLLFPWPKRK